MIRCKNCKKELGVADICSITCLMEWDEKGLPEIDESEELLEACGILHQFIEAYNRDDKIRLGLAHDRAFKFMERGKEK